MVIERFLYHSPLAMIALLAVQSSTRTVFLQCYFAHRHLQKCIIQAISFANYDAIFGDNYRSQ